MEKVNELAQFESYQQWYRSLARRSRKGEVSEKMRSNYDSVLRQLVKFFHSEIDGDEKANPDTILEWARSVEPEEVSDSLGTFERWLQGEEVEGYRKRNLVRNERYAKPETAAQRAQGSARGFFTHNKLWLPRSSRKMKRRSVTKKNDVNYAIFKVDPDTNMVVQDYTQFRYFLSNLKFRDQTVALALLSTSQDTGDLLNLRIGFVEAQKHRARLLWEGSRIKTGEEFRTFFSKEATRFLRQYIEQEREGAKAEEPIFIRTNGKPLLQRNLSENFNAVAKKMGLLNNGDAQNPFRPKRLRSIFSSACYQAKIDDGAKHIFMGHAGTVSEKYREMPAANLELIYQQVEVFVTVYAEDRSQELVASIAKSEKALDMALDIRMENKRLKKMVEELAEKLGRFSSFIEMLGYDWDPETGEVSYSRDKDQRR